MVKLCNNRNKSRVNDQFGITRWLCGETEREREREREGGGVNERDGMDEVIWSRGRAGAGDG